MAKYTDKNGNEVRIGKELGHGGEASVFAIEGNDSIVAKIYNDSHKIDNKKLKKLEKMCTLFDDSIAKYYAWPQRIIYSNNRAVGFLMENINLSNSNQNPSEYIKFVNFYTWKYRRKLFPNAEYKFVVHAATNIAIAIYTLHEKDIVIGDINESNVFVNNIDTTIKLIDCDSYQIEDFLCDVGTLNYTAPELPNKLRGVRRTKNNDYFALAVMIFQILVGIHPYFGLGNTHNDNLRLSITEGLYCYGKDAESKSISPQYPFSETYNALSEEIKNLFEQAFTSTNRPTAKDWIDALSKYENELIPCSHDSHHFYHQSSKSCVWCEIQEKGYYAFGKSNTPSVKIQHNYNKQTQYQSSLQNIQQTQNVTGIASIQTNLYSSKPQIPKTNPALKYTVIITVIIFIAIIVSSNSDTNKISTDKSIGSSSQNIPIQRRETYTDTNTDYDYNYNDNESTNSNADYYQNENSEQYYVSCKADSTLKALKKIRTNELKPLLEDNRYIFNSNYSLWYRNTIDQTNEGDCFTDEMIKNLFWADPNVYLVHRISYEAHKENNNILINQNGYYSLDDLLTNSDFYKGNNKLSSREINNLLEKSLFNSNQVLNNPKPKYQFSTPNTNSPQTTKQNIDKAGSGLGFTSSSSSKKEVSNTQTTSKKQKNKYQNTSSNTQYSKLPTEPNPVKPVGSENDFFE